LVKEKEDWSPDSYHHKSDRTATINDPNKIQLFVDGQIEHRDKPEKVSWTISYSVQLILQWIYPGNTSS
jgi:hypothetical protein